MTGTEGDGEAEALFWLVFVTIGVAIGIVELGLGFEFPKDVVPNSSSAGLLAVISYCAEAVAILPIEFWFLVFALVKKKTAAKTEMMTKDHPMPAATLLAM